MIDLGGLDLDYILLICMIDLGGLDLDYILLICVIVLGGLDLDYRTVILDECVLFKLNADMSR